MVIPTLTSVHSNGQFTSSNCSPRAKPQAILGRMPLAKVKRSADARNVLDAESRLAALA
jgi:hypothetical protein